MVFRWIVFFCLIIFTFFYFELTIIYVVYKREINLSASENRQQFVAFFFLSFRQIFSEISEINGKAGFPFLESTEKNDNK